MKYELLIEKWLSNPPANESSDVVESVLVHYFGVECLKSKAGSSHQYRIKDLRLADLTQFAPFGYLSVPISGGQKVKKVYLKQIAQAVKYIEYLKSLKGSSDE